MAKSADLARAVYTEMRAEGYVVKAVEIGSGREFEMRDGNLVPVPGRATAAAPAIPAWA
jgi:hypothetical protein